MKLALPSDSSVRALLWWLADECDIGTSLMFSALYSGSWQSSGWMWVSAGRLDHIPVPNYSSSNRWLSYYSTICILQWSMDTATVSLHQIETSEKLCGEAALAWAENYSWMFISLAYFWWYTSSVFVQLQSRQPCVAPSAVYESVGDTFQGQRRGKNLFNFTFATHPASCCALPLPW